jgi:hypothetical protein
MSVMQSRVGVLDSVPSVNGRYKLPRKPVRKPRGKQEDRARRWITIGVGCGIPAMSLTLSRIGGGLLVGGHTGLGSCAMLLCCTVLAVSLSHLAWALRDITKSRPWQAWCMAIACDVAIVVCELVHVAGVEWLAVSGLMWACTVASMVLNCWAFAKHK